jgi:hypothetical protein
MLRDSPASVKRNRMPVRLAREKIAPSALPCTSHKNRLAGRRLTKIVKLLPPRRSYPLRRNGPQGEPQTISAYRLPSVDDALLEDAVER